MKHARKTVCTLLIAALLLGIVSVATAGGAKPYWGEIGLYPYYDYVPKRWKAANGELLAVTGNEELFNRIGTKFGGDGTTSFKLPDLRDYAPPNDSLRYDIAVQGDAGRKPITSEVRLFSYDAAAQMPSIWRRCDGASLRIDDDDYVTLYNFIGNSYGGDLGELTYALPDLRALEPEGMGYYICMDGVWVDGEVFDGYLGEMILIASSYMVVSASNAIPCDGRLLPVAENRALHSLLGANFGGDGENYFAIPNTCGGSGAPSELMNPLPELRYYIVTSGSFPDRAP